MLQAQAKELVGRLDATWRHIGYTAAEKQAMLDSIVRSFGELYTGKVQGTEQYKAQLETELATARAELAAMERQIGSEVTPLKEDESLLSAITSTARLAHSARETKVRRERILQEQYTDMKAACCKMGQAVPQHIAAQYGSCLSLDFMRQMEKGLEQVRREHGSRKSKLNVLRNQIAHIVRDLELYHDESKSPHPVDQMALDGEEDPVCDDASIAESQQRLQTLTEQLASRMEYIASIESELEMLWLRLKVDESHRSSFLNKMDFAERNTTRCSATKVSMLETELEEMKVMRRESVRSLIEESRRQILSLWDKLMYGSQQRSAFPLIQEDAFTEEALELHEKEEARLETHVESLVGILKLLETRESYYNEVEAVGLLSKDPNRLKRRDAFKILKREERARTIEKKKLPALEAKLRKVVEQWEEEHGTDLCMNDRRLLEVLHVETKSEHKSTASRASSKTRSVAASSKRSSRKRASHKKRQPTPSGPASPLTSECSSMQSSHPMTPKVLDFQPSYADLAEEAQQKGDLEAAADYYTKAIEAAVTSDELCGLYYKRGSVYQSLNKFSKALEDSDMALKMNERT